jgi:hypothetical protein
MVGGQQPDQRAGAAARQLGNSDHPATTGLAQQLRVVCQGEIIFRNRDVEAAVDLAA